MMIRYTYFAEACTRACDEFGRGSDCAVFVDSREEYWVLDFDGLKRGEDVRLTYDPANGVPILTAAYRGPDRRSADQITSTWYPDRRQPQPVPQSCTGDRIWGFMQKILAPEYHGEDV